MRTGPFWTRLAAASGMGFAATAVAAYALQSSKDLAAGAMATSTEGVWGSWTLLVAVTGVFLLWFTSTATARLREIEGGSRRVSVEHFAAGTVIAAALFLEVAIQFAIRGAESADALSALATSIVSGPALAFAAGVYILSAGVVGARAGATLPLLSGALARVSLVLGLALIAGGGLWVFRDYAWLNDTAFFSFVIWVFVFSATGVARWAGLDEGALTISLPPATRRPATTRRTRIPEPPRVEDMEDTFDVPRVTRPSATAESRRSRPARARAKPGTRKPATRKPSTARKTATPRKPSAERKTAPKRAPRKPAPRPVPPAAPGPATEPAPTTAADQEQARTEDIFERFGIEELSKEDET